MIASFFINFNVVFNNLNKSNSNSNNIVIRH